MRIQVETRAHHGRDVPRTLYLHGRRVAVVEIIDQWFGSDYRYCKLRGDDGALYILRVVEHCAEWRLTMFASERAQALSGLSSKHRE